MRRREFITLLGGAVVVSWPLATRAQQATSNIPRVGFLALPNSGVKEIQQGLHQLGYIEGQNMAFEVLSLQGQLERLRELGNDWAGWEREFFNLSVLTASYRQKLPFSPRALSA
jgi:hypothetical protein